MNEYDVKRLILAFAIQAEIEGMKASNNQYPQDQPYGIEHFNAKADELRLLANKHSEQL